MENVSSKEEGQGCGTAEAQLMSDPMLGRCACAFEPQTNEKKTWLLSLDVLYSEALGGGVIYRGRVQVFPSILSLEKTIHCSVNKNQRVIRLFKPIFFDGSTALESKTCPHSC